ncbi:MAG: tetratricopeptide repeat protein [Saprospiraceae bacterium]|nr:tetratricopeptide repeat protein [Saprospiraceae bacterium]
MQEVYFKLERYTDAWDNFNLSLRKAKALNQFRAMAVANAGLGDVCYIKKQYDTAIKYYDESKIYALESKNYDIALVCYSGIAKCELVKSNEQAVKINLKLGYDLIKNQPDINRKYVLKFLDDGIDINKNMGKVDDLTMAYDNVMTNDVFNGSGITRYLVSTLNSRIIWENTLLKRLINYEKSKNYTKYMAYTIMMVSSTIILGLIFGFTFFGDIINLKFNWQKSNNQSVKTCMTNLDSDSLLPIIYFTI